MPAPLIWTDDLDACLIHYANEGRSHVAIGERLGISPHAAGVRLKRLGWRPPSKNTAAKPSGSAPQAVVGDWWDDDAGLVRYMPQTAYGSRGVGMAALPPDVRTIPALRSELIQPKGE